MEVEQMPIPQPLALWARVITIIDGDTIEAQIHLGFGISVRKKIRLLGIDTPEMTGPQPAEAARCQQLLQDLIPPGVLVELHKPRCLPDCYCRVLANVRTADHKPVIDSLPDYYRTTERPKPQPLDAH
jgi:endonuclease YncB( thermonuclease family)